MAGGLSLLVCGLVLVSVLALAPREGSAGEPSSRTVGTAPRVPGPRNQLASLRQRHQSAYLEFSEQVQQLAQAQQDAHRSDVAEAIRARIIRPETLTFRGSSLPAEFEPEIPRDLPPVERAWRVQLRNLELTYARELYQLSRQVLHAGYPALAFQLVREVAVHDPDHEGARRLLGFVRHDGQWMTPFAARMARQHYVWHPRFGWLPRGHLDRYAAGDRFCEGRWMSAEKEAEIRRDFAKAWNIETEHYIVKTNHSLERGVAVAAALEQFHEFFYELFSGFFNTPAQLRKQFESAGQPGRVSRQYVVHYYRTRDEYLERLRPQIARIDLTQGLYLTADRIAYFYHDPQATDDSTLFHEATHQLFYESDPHERSIAEQGHFWLIEGIACYMESFRPTAEDFSVGDPDYIRFRLARRNFVDERYYIPMQAFFRLNGREFQSAEQLPKNYSQAAGFAHFFMHYDGGRYRDALVRQLSQVYSGNRKVRERIEGLDQLTGSDFDELDRQYADFLQQLDGEIQSASHLR